MLYEGHLRTTRSGRVSATSWLNRFSCLIFALLLFSPAHAVTEGEWKSGGTVTGANLKVNASTTGSDGSIYFGGEFTRVNGIAANYIIKWNVATETFEPLGNGMSWYVTALTTGTDGSIFAAGGFTDSSGTATHTIAKWDPLTETWSSPGTGTIYGVSAMTTGVDGSIYVTGSFSSADGVSANKIAKWDTATETWSALGEGLSSTARALLTAADGSIYAAGYFTTAGGISANRIAKWNPATETWSALGEGLNGGAESVTSGADGSIYVGGRFIRAGGIFAPRVAKWDPTLETWSALGSFTDGDVYSMATGIDGSIFAAGRFTRAGGVSANRIAKWDTDTESWNPLGAGLGSETLFGDALALSTGLDGSIYAGGDFTKAGGDSVNRIAKWDPAAEIWSAPGAETEPETPGLNGEVMVLTTAADGSIYAGGVFTTAGGNAANRVAKWNPMSETWSALGDGFNDAGESHAGYVRSLTTTTDGSVYAGGILRTDGAYGIAKWNPVTAAWEPVGSGFNNAALALTTGLDQSIYAGGWFTSSDGMAVNRIAKWDPLSETWSALGEGLSSVNAMTTGADGSIYVGGSFTTAGAIDASRIVKWNPVTETWSALGEGLNSTVTALTTGADGSIYAGGHFTTAGGTSASKIAKWDPVTETWSAPGEGLNGSVYALTTGANGSIYAGGSFSAIGEKPANRIAKWNPETETWSTLEEGLDWFGVALTTGADGTVYVGGRFATAGTMPSLYFASWEPCLVPVANAGGDQTLDAISITTVVTLDATNSCVADKDDDDLTYTWTGSFGTETGLTAEVELPPGETTITLEVNDGSTSGTDTIVIAVVDSTAPSITVPDNVSTVATGETTPLTAAQLGTATAHDIVNGSVAAIADNSGPFPVGETTVTWTAVDEAGNEGTAIQTVTIIDTAPVVIAPDSLSVDATGATTMVDPGTATATDAVDGVLTATPDNSGPYPLGNTTVTWSATDSNGNTATATQLITITDTGPPVVTPPANIATEATGPATPIDPGAAGAIDAVDGTLVAVADKSGPYPVGITTVIWSATDTAGNTGTATQTITINDTSGPVVAAPANMSIEASGATTLVATGVATANDIVDGPLPPVASLSGPFPVGITTINWSATDSSGNSATAVQTVTVTDSIAPVVTAPGDITASATGASTTVDPGTASATDRVDGALTAIADNTGPYPAGITLVTWSATDSEGNTGTATQTITLNDNGAPVVTAPANVTAEATGVNTLVSLGTATATDAIDGTLTTSPDNPGPYPPGATTVTWSATDAAGNTGVAMQTVLIVDSSMPVVTAPPNITAEATGLTTSVDTGSAIATDTVDGNLMATADKSGPYPPGVTSVLWTAIDSAGNTGSAVQTITITDSSAPVVVAPADISTEATGFATVVNLGVASATDSVEGVLAAIPDNTGPYPVGTTTVTWSAVDSHGNTGTAAQQVTITDVASPVVTAPANIIAEATGVTTLVDSGVGSVEDNVDGAIIAMPDNTGPYLIGVSNVIWSATDSAGNTGTATQTVTVIDTTAPVVTAPENISITTDSATLVNLGTASATDTVDGAVVVTVDNPGPYSIGTTIVTWSATDSAGNTGTATQTVSLSDIGAPVVTAPAAITAEATGATTIVDPGTASAVDAAEGAVTATPDNTGPYPVGTTTVIWNATDIAGNTGTAAQTVTITDTTAPSITVPENVSAQATGATTSIDPGTANATDIVDGPLDPIADNPGPYNVGTTLVTWSVTDNAGNNATATQSVTITDSEYPVVNAPANIIVEATGITTAVDPGTATSTDLVDGVLSASPDFTGPFTVGDTTVNWTATDTAGNTATAAQVVTIIDSQSPTIIAPVDITGIATGATTPVNTGTAIAIDTVDGILTATPDNAGPFQPGTTTIIWSATDTAGNAATASQTIVLSDANSPLVTAPPAVVAEASGVVTPIDLGIASATDSIDGELIPIASNTGPFKTGTTTVTWSATDVAGNTGVATQLVTITDSVTPVVTAPANITAEATGSATTVSLGEASASDSVDKQLVAVADSTGPFPVGTTTVTWSATDSAGNTGSAIQLVNIIDTAKPVVTAPGTITANSTGPTTLLSLGTATAVDSVDGTLVASADNIGPFALGTTTVTWSATDRAGNKATATQTVIVNDNGSPLVAAPADITTEATGTATTINIGNARATDFVDGNLDSSADNTGPFPPGETIVTWVATDSAGNTGTAQQTITVKDTGRPVVTAPANVTTEATGFTTVVDPGTASATDLLAGELPATADNPGPYPVGRTTVTWTATDPSGNTTTATQLIHVIDSTPPVVVAPADINLESTGETTELALGTATATDLVDGELITANDSQGVFETGETLVTWFATDNAGNTGTATQLITITDEPEFMAALEESIDGAVDAGSIDQAESGTGSMSPVEYFAITLLMLLMRRRLSCRPLQQ